MKMLVKKLSKDVVEDIKKSEELNDELIKGNQKEE